MDYWVVLFSLKLLSKFKRYFFEELCTCWQSRTKTSELCESPLFCYLCWSWWKKVPRISSKLLNVRMIMQQKSVHTNLFKFRNALDKIFFSNFVYRYTRSNCKITYHGKVYWHFFTTATRLYRYSSFIVQQPPEVFYKKGVLKNFAKFTEKYLRQGLLFNKFAGLDLQLY